MADDEIIAGLIGVVAGAVGTGGIGSVWVKAKYELVKKKAEIEADEAKERRTEEAQHREEQEGLQSELEKAAGRLKASWKTGGLGTAAVEEGARTAVAAVCSSEHFPPTSPVRRAAVELGDAIDARSPERVDAALELMNH